MWLLKITSPKNIPSHKTDWNWHVRLHGWIISKLRRLYSRGAVNDIIQLGNVKIIHNVRDYWYEQELRRYHLYVEPRPKAVSQKYHSPKWLFRSCLFRWEESLSVSDNDKSYSVRRKKRMAIDSDIIGRLMVSEPQDSIVQTKFISDTDATENTDTSNNSRPPKRNTKNKRGKIRIKDQRDNPKPKQPVQTVPQTTKFKGFEENNSF